MAWLGLAIFLITFAVIGWLIRDRRKDPDLSERDDPYPGWRHADGKDAYDALTDPNLPAVGYERPEPEPEPVADTVIFGTVVDDGEWAEETAVPAPAIVASPVHHEQALAWISKWEDEDNARLAIAGSR
jgi:hypothetical protein